MHKVYMICTLTVTYSLLLHTSTLTACQCPHLVHTFLTSFASSLTKQYRDLARTLTSLVTACVDIKTHCTLIIQIIHESYVHQCSLA